MRRQGSIEFVHEDRTGNKSPYAYKVPLDERAPGLFASARLEPLNRFIFVVAGMRFFLHEVCVRHPSIAERSLLVYSVHKSGKDPRAGNSHIAINLRGVSVEPHDGQFSD